MITHPGPQGVFVLRYPDPPRRPWTNKEKAVRDPVSAPAHRCPARQSHHRAAGSLPPLSTTQT
ncbi:hypothetical protein [Streptomyces antibioticus]|uniref:Uncharacterized protein n=1 Tax=Streptomyces antibioticus TaxID=1890 RepID=A0AAE6Y370_STRAT|nr:hypothetical protein [Streptomyces antibioticus]MCX5166501.1 hypothetical protein [Streptomyces antibioticus]QIT42193.1 hypothetical protein HCX60_00495 [Streptomyces antibioticus]